MDLVVPLLHQVFSVPQSQSRHQNLHAALNDDVELVPEVAPVHDRFVPLEELVLQRLNDEGVVCISDVPLPEKLDSLHVLDDLLQFRHCPENGWLLEDLHDLQEVVPTHTAKAALVGAVASAQCPRSSFASVSHTIIYTSVS